MPPSFNDIRLVLNTAQLLGLVRSGGGVELVTFDGDVTLYDDGASLTPDNPVIERILGLLGRGVRVGIVTAAGYVQAEKYYGRLAGLLDAVASSSSSTSSSSSSSPIRLTSAQKENLIVMGGESNFLFRFSPSAACHLEAVPTSEWLLEEMKAWTEADIAELLSVAEGALKQCVRNLSLDVEVLRKERAVGIYPPVGKRLPREVLEETVLVVQQIVELSEVGRRIPFCAFNGTLCLLPYAF